MCNCQSDFISCRMRTKQNKGTSKMWNSLSNINLYENLLTRKSADGVSITENDVKFNKMCRTCLREAPDADNLLKDFEIGAINFNMDGKVIKIIDMLSESTSLEITETDYLPHQICNNCIQNISGTYFFRLQCHKAENILCRLHNALSSFSSPCKSQSDFAFPNNDESLSHNSEDEQITSDNGDEYEKDMKIEFDGVEYKIDSEIIRIDQEDVQENLDEYSDIEKDFPEDSSIPNIKIEIVDQHNPDESESTSLASEPLKKMSYKCMECDQVFDKKKHYNEHLRIFHPFSKVYKCEICDSRFTKGQSLKRHMMIHQADQKNKLCTFCGKGFTRADDLRRHTRIHTGERPYACTICPKRYKQTSELKEHMVTHSKDKNYICTICGKALQTRNGHYVHMRTHLGIKKHICELCGSRYVTSGELHSHIRHIHEKRKPFACDIVNCGRTFGTKPSLDIHKRAHNGERPFECAYCNKRLATASSLADHTRIHTETNCFLCAICHLIFHGSQTLKKHMRTHIEHSDEIKDTPETDSVKKNAFECLVCGNQFSTLNHLENHSSIHCNNDVQFQKMSGFQLIVEEAKAEHYVIEMECEDDTVQYVDS